MTAQTIGSLKPVWQMKRDIRTSSKNPAQATLIVTPNLPKQRLAYIVVVQLNTWVRNASYKVFSKYMP